MPKREFASDWTSDKLERVRQYLCAYTTIFQKNVRASYFTTIYVDAFSTRKPACRVGQPAGQGGGGDDYTRRFHIADCLGSIGRDRMIAGGTP
jgi:hypothetical protein